MSENEFTFPLKEIPTSRFHRFKRRFTSADTYREYGRRARYYSVKRRKPIGIAAISLLILFIFLAAVLVVVLTKSGKSKNDNPTIVNLNSQVVTFIFNIGHKPLGRMAKSAYGTNEIDEGRIVLKKAINRLAPNISNGEFSILLIPYSNKVLKEQIRSNIQNVEETLNAIDQLFDQAPQLDGNPSQYEAVTYYMDSIKKTNELEGLVFAQKQSGSFVFLAPKQRLYESDAARYMDNQDTGKVLRHITTKVGKTFLVGLDNNNDMTSDYGLDSSSVGVLPNGVADIEKVVDDITNDIPLVITTLKPPTVKIITKAPPTIKTKSTQKSTPKITTPKVTTRKPTTTTTPPFEDFTTDLPEEGSTDYYSSLEPLIKKVDQDGFYIPVEDF